MDSLTPQLQQMMMGHISFTTNGVELGALAKENLAADIGALVGDR